MICFSIFSPWLWMTKSATNIKDKKIKVVKIEGKKTFQIDRHI